MKKLLSGLLLILIVSQGINASEKNMIRTNFLADILGILNLHYERTISDHLTVDLGGWTNSSLDDSLSAQSYGVMLKYYPESAQNGWFFGVGGSQNSYTIDWDLSGVEDTDVTLSGIDVQIGYIKPLKSNLNVGFTLGAMLTESKTYTEVAGLSTATVETASIIPNLGVQIGYRF